MEAKQILEVSKNIIITSDHDGHLRYVNPSFYRLLGYSEGEVIDEKFLTFVHPDDAEYTAAQLHSLTQGEEGCCFENRCLHKSGRVIHISWNFFTLPNANTMYGIGNDITLLKHTEQDLVKAGHLLEAAESIAHVGGWELDLDINKMYWTEETYRIHDTTPEEFTPTLETSLDFYLPESRQRLTRAIEAAIDAGGTYDEELQMITAKGRRIHVRTTGVAIKINGNPAKLTGAIQDITQLKQTQRLLDSARENAENSERFLHNIINYIGDPFFVKDSDSRLLLVNDSFCTLFGLSKNDVIGKTLAEHVPPDEREHFLSIDNEVLSTGKESIVEESLTLPNGPSRTISTRKTRYIDPYGNSYLIGTIRDLTARKQAEEALKQSKEKFTSAFQNAPYASSIINIKTGKRLAVNQAFCEILGYQEEALIGHDRIPLIEYPDDDQEIIHQLSSKRAIQKYPLQIDTLSGETKKMRLNLAYLYPNNDEVLITALQDITEDSRKEMMLQRSARVFNLALDLSCIAGFDGYFKFLNPAWERTLGWSTTELMSRPWMDFVHRDDKYDTENVKTVILDGKEVLQFENRYICKDGSVKWLSWNSQPFPAENIMIGVARDVTLVKEAELSMRRSNQLLVASQSIARLGGWELSVPDNELYWTAETYRIHDTSPEEFDPNVDKALGFYLPKSRKKINTAFKKALTKGVGYDLTLQTHTAKGRRIDVRTTCEVILQDGKPIKLYGIFQDITDQKKAEEELLAAKENAESANRLKSAFLANMSHEIRTPVNSVIGFADLLKEDGLTAEKRKQYLDIVASNSRQLLHLIDDILDFAKIEAQELKISLSDCNVEALVAELETIYNQLKAKDDKADISFVASIPDRFKDLTIITDCHRLRQVISNLLNNALKFSNTGTISFGYDVKGKDLVFFVKDEGAGIPENKLDQIFDRFKQVESSENTSRRGSGLGLAICKGIVQLLGGQITVKSVVNQGSTFTFSIPFVPSTSEKVKTESPKKNTSLKNKTILIVEDGVSARYYLKEVLKSSQANLLFANNGRHGLELYQAHPDINVVLMDIGMPVMNGFEASQKILEINPDANIIIQSAYAMTEEKEKCFRIGCCEYLTKPIQKEDILRALHKWA